MSCTIKVFIINGQRVYSEKAVKDIVDLIMTSFSFPEITMKTIEVDSLEEWSRMESEKTKRYYE